LHREEPNPDDREADIADDPLLNAISSELHAINKRSDMKLLIALTLNVAVVMLVARLQIKSMWLDLVEAAVVVTILGGTIYSVVRAEAARRRTLWAGLLSVRISTRGLDDPVGRDHAALPQMRIAAAQSLSSSSRYRRAVEPMSASGTNRTL
jgi:hypothetical protein